MVIQVENLIKEFKEIRALDSFNLELKEGEILGLIGPTVRENPRCCSAFWEFTPLKKGKSVFLTRN